MGSERQQIDIPTSSKSECPVCFQIPRAHIFQCASGHSMCDVCSAKITTCPSCRSSGVRIRNLLAESLLDDIKFKCSWSDRGCEKTMRRGELSAHEDLCDQNPDVVKFCSIFNPGSKCQYKLTSKWLSEHENYIEFIKHVENCLGYKSHGKILLLGKGYRASLELDSILLHKPIPGRPLHFAFNPSFYRVDSINEGKVELLSLMILLKFDTLGNQFMSFVLVQLTPKTTPMSVKFTIDGMSSSLLVSKWGQYCLPSQNWTQKTIDFKGFREMVENCSNGSKTRTSDPFSLPVSFLSEYYVSADKKVFLNITLEKTS